MLAFGLGLLTPLLRPVLPALDPTAPLLPTTVAMPVWAPYVAIVVAVIIGFLCLRWLVAQTQRRPRTGTWNVAAATAAGRTRLAAATAADAIASDIHAYPGVRKATATLWPARAALRHCNWRSASSATPPSPRYATASPATHCPGCVTPCSSTPCPPSCCCASTPRLHHPPSPLTVSEWLRSRATQPSGRSA